MEAGEGEQGGGVVQGRPQWRGALAAQTAAAAAAGLGSAALEEWKPFERFLRQGVLALVGREGGSGWRGREAPGAEGSCCRVSGTGLPGLGRLATFGARMGCGRSASLGFCVYFVFYYLCYIFMQARLDCVCIIYCFWYILISKVEHMMVWVLK